MAKLQTTDEDKLIGKRIQQKRKEKGLSAAFLSEQIDVSQQQLSRYETGSNKINVAHLIAIANYLETPISWFFLDNDRATKVISDMSSKQIEQHTLTLEEMKTRLNDYWDMMSLEQKASLLHLIEQFMKRD